MKKEDSWVGVRDCALCLVFCVLCVQEAALRACLEGKTHKIASAWRYRGRVSANLVPAAACHFENTRIQGEVARAFHSARLLAAAYVEGYCL